MSDFVNTSVFAMNVLIVVAFTGIAPIADINAAVVRWNDRDAAEPGVIDSKKIVRVLRDVS